MSAIYAIGSNGSGQLGIGHKEDVSVPKPVLFNISIPSNVTQVKAGGNHTLLLASGVLFCSGDPITGACGVKFDSNAEESSFKEVRLSSTSETSPMKSRIVLCTATWEASIIVLQNENGLATKIYSFGTGNKGELGLGESIFRSSQAQILKDFPPLGLEIVDLSASVSHVVAVLSNGEVYGWGNGRKGQLGEPESVISVPRKIEGVGFKVKRAVCGREFTFLVGESSSGHHVVLGSNKWNVRASAPPNMIGWKDVGATWGSIYVLQEDGKLLSWGRDDHGQLAPPSLPLLSQIVIGSEHALGLTTEGDVLAWGWGEHGNCGPGTTNGDVKGRWNIIGSSKYLPPGSRISTIGAGCATSWVCIDG